MDTAPHLICAYALDGHGGARRLGWDEASKAAGSPAAPIWLHLQRDAPATRQWLERESGLDEILCDALLSDESRPRCEAMGDGLLVSLRGVNLNPGADPEDMVALVLWADANRVISVRRRRIMAVDALREAFEHGSGPRTTGDFVARVSDGLVERMGPVIDELEDTVDGMEEAIVRGESEGVRLAIAELRRTAIGLRRYIAPQREAMARLLTHQQLGWLSAADVRLLREVADRILRYVEDLDAARERAQVAQDELTNKLSEQLNRNMYVLSVIAAIFLPLGLITGYLGINVGGIPGANWGYAFAVVGVGLVLIAALQLWLFRRLKWV